MFPSAKVLPDDSYFDITERNSLIEDARKSMFGHIFENDNDVCAVSLFGDALSNEPAALAQ